MLCLDITDVCEVSGSANSIRLVQNGASDDSSADAVNISKKPKFHQLKFVIRLRAVWQEGSTIQRKGKIKSPYSENNSGSNHIKGTIVVMKQIRKSHC